MAVQCSTTISICASQTTISSFQCYKIGVLVQSAKDAQVNGVIMQDSNNNFISEQFHVNEILTYIYMHRECGFDLLQFL